MRKSEYEAMIIDDRGKIHDLQELDTSFKVMKALKEMDQERGKSEKSEKSSRSPLLARLIHKRRI